MFEFLPNVMFPREVFGAFRTPGEPQHHLSGRNGSVGTMVVSCCETLCYIILWLGLHFDLGSKYLYNHHLVPDSIEKLYIDVSRFFGVSCIIYLGIGFYPSALQKQEPRAKELRIEFPRMTVT